MDSFPCATCGATIEPQTNGRTGYGKTADGRRHCYPCCDRAEAEAFAAADAHFAYLSGDGNSVTTWTGGELARVTYRKRHAGTWGGEWWTVDAVAPDGARWYGRGPGPGMYLRLRRRKAPRRATVGAA